MLRFKTCTRRWQTQSKHDAHKAPLGGGEWGVAADRGTYVELVYELLQDTWRNILQQTISQCDVSRRPLPTVRDAVSCTVERMVRAALKMRRGLFDIHMDC